LPAAAIIITRDIYAATPQLRSLPPLRRFAYLTYAFA